MPSWGILLLMSLLQWSAESVSPQLPKNKCVADSGKTYSIGSVFTDNNCTTRCECLEDGIVSCQPMCSVRKKDKCPNPTIVHTKVGVPDAEGRSCSCPSFICEQEAILLRRAECIVGKKTYKPGSRFISSDCSGFCRCHPDGVVSCNSLCPPVHVICGHDEEKIKFLRKIPKSNCSCPRWRCVKRKQNDFCEISPRERHKIGEHFQTKDCTKNCKCTGPNEISCVPLCPLRGIRCSPGTRQVGTTIPAFPGSNCTCPSWKCVELDYCEFSPGERHKIGEYFEAKDCGGYCRCKSPNEMSCVSLCPPHGLFCRPGTRKVRTTISAFPGSNCTCPSWKCVKALTNSPAAPCGVLRINSVKDDIWPRCDDQGYFEPLQCDPSKNECWCVDKWGNVEPGSQSLSLKTQCGFSHVNTPQDSSTR